MATQHFPFDLTKSHAQQLKSCMVQLENGNQLLNSLVDTLSVMLDGNDGTQAAHFNYIVSKFGFGTVDVITANETAKAAFEELTALRLALTPIQAALLQAIAKFRQ